MHDLVAVLAGARIGATHNQYTDSTIRRERLRAYLAARRDAPILLVGEAAGYRGARVSGIPFTSERQLTGTGPAEASATVVHDALADLGATDEVLLWNVVPTHPGTECSNRPPTRAEIAAARPYLIELARGRHVVAVGRVAERELGAPYVRHPSHGGVPAFRAGLAAALAAAGGESVDVEELEGAERPRREVPKRGVRRARARHGDQARNAGPFGEIGPVTSSDAD